MLLDLTHGLCPGMPVYPGAEAPVFELINTLRKDGFAEKKIQMSTHTGTHMDAPCHLFEGAASLDQYPISNFAGHGAVLDCSKLPGRIISLETVQHLAAHVFDAQYLLLYTGWDHFWGSDAYYRGYPVLADEAAQWLTDAFLLKGIGVDAISMDAENQPHLPIHRRFLKNGLLIIENLMNLKALLGKSFIFYAFPIKVEEADGAPVRAAAHIMEE